MDFSYPNIERHMHFICPECGIELPTQVIWRKHLNSSHDYHKKTVEVFNFKRINERYHECNECHKWVANGNQSITTLQYHRISHLPFNLTFKCRHCVRAFARKRALCTHLFHEHKNILDADNNASRQAEVTVPPPSSAASKSDSDNLDEFILQGLDPEKDQADIIQKALLDSLIDLENESFPVLNKSSCENNVNEFVLDQSLSDLEAILKGDLEAGNSVLPQPYTSSFQQQLEQYEAGHFSTELAEIEDNELEEICADIFEEVVEPVEHATADRKTEYRLNPSLSVFKSSTAEKDKESESYEEKIISIEIDTVNESERRNMFSSPKRKRLRLDLPPSRTLEMNNRIKKLLESYIVYLCPECGREFKTQGEWRDHVFKAHDLTNTMYAKFQALRNGEKHMCLECREMLTNANTQDLLRHRFTHMPFQSYLKCTFCAKTKSSKPKIMQHLQDFHASTLARPMSEKIAPAHLICSCCDKSFQTHERYKLHQQICQPRKKYSKTKDTSDSIITNNLNLIAHLKKMRARMRSLRNECNAGTTKT